MWRNIFWCLARVWCQHYCVRSDTLWGSEPPHLQAGAFKSLGFWCYRDPLAIDLFCSLIYTLSVMEYHCAKLHSRFAPVILANHFLFNVWGKSLARIEQENVHLHVLWHRNIFVLNKVKINQQNKSVMTGPIYVHWIWSDLSTPTWKCGGFSEPHRVLNLITLGPCLCKTPKYFFASEKWFAMTCW